MSLVTAFAFASERSASQIDVVRSHLIEDQDQETIGNLTSGKRTSRPRPRAARCHQDGDGEDDSESAKLIPSKVDTQRADPGDRKDAHGKRVLHLRDTRSVPVMTLSKNVTRSR